MNTKPSKDKNKFRSLFAISAQFRTSAGAMKVKGRNNFKHKGICRILAEEELDKDFDKEEKEWWEDSFESKQEAEEWLKNEQTSVIEE